MSFAFRDKDRPSLRDRLRGKSGDQILEELRKKLDKDKEMFFERVPNPPSFRRAGFPFDDDGLRARGRPDFRQRLEELAQQHPEFADSLRPWYDEQQVPQHPPAGDAGWGFRQRTGSNSSQPQAAPTQQQQQDGNQAEAQQPQPGLAHHGLRNTVDLGEAQAQAQAQASEQDSGDDRGKRAQSAPPAPDQTMPHGHGLDIHPQPADAAPNQDPAAAKPPSGSKQHQAPPQAAKPGAGNGGNVRQIPIFVEGRDEPVLARDDVDSSAANFGQGFPHHQPRAGPFGHQGFSRSNMSFPSFHARDSQDQEAPAHKRPFGQQHQQPPPAPPTRQQQQQQPRQPQPQPPRQRTPPRQQPAPQPPPQQQPQQQEPAPPPQQTKPKDPLDKVRDVQEEVQSLSKQVDEFVGTRQDKQYLFLDEMLTRELIKLDVIETEGRDDVRTARKETIRAITQCISRLEAKTAPATPSVESMDVDPSASAESMDVSAASSQEAGPAEQPQQPQSMDTTPAGASAPAADAAAPHPEPVPAPAPTPAASAAPATPGPATESSSAPTPAGAS
ncbi:hypothetical protein ONE63_008411 [Megalurothrips usitatus]|uniref:BAG domain-containing protein n=1 Tax=Megalurothrips usitatus TaxID=439358 RepID=A0AAV7XSZ1_9NEOP|nr:hypothetical protein ONE63_008411 [Megalurothrips usitatus]